VNGLRFSIIVTSYNQREFIADAVDSAVALRDSSVEVIVVDDGSTDGSPAFLGTYGEAVRFVALGANRGRGAARNYGAALARGEYLVFLDGDDLLLPWSLDVYDTIVNARNPRIILATMRWFDGNASTVLHSGAPSQLQFVEYEDYLRKDRSYGASASALIVERGAFDAVHGWSNLDVLEDQELLLRLSTAGPTVQLLSPPTVGHRRHPAQSVQHVPPFLAALADLIQKECAAGFPGGRPRRRERQSTLGALAYFWSKRAIRAGLHRTAASLIAQTWHLQLFAAARRLSTTIVGRQPPSVISIHGR
jgi:hypothetical protein